MPTTPSPPPPYRDELRFKELGDTTVGRYASTLAGIDDARYRALAELRRRAALTGTAEDVYSSHAGAQYGATADISDARLAGDSERVGDWWDMMPGVQYERLKGLGGAGIAEFEKARKKRLAAAAAAAKRAAASSQSAYNPIEQWDPFAAVNQAMADLAAFDAAPKISGLLW